MFVLENKFCYLVLQRGFPANSALGFWTDPSGVACPGAPNLEKPRGAGSLPPVQVPTLGVTVPQLSSARAQLGLSAGNPWSRSPRQPALFHSVVWSYIKVLSTNSPWEEGAGQHIGFQAFPECEPNKHSKQRQLCAVGWGSQQLRPRFSHSWLWGSFSLYRSYQMTSSLCQPGKYPASRG